MFIKGSAVFLIDARMTEGKNVVIETNKQRRVADIGEVSGKRVHQELLSKSRVHSPLLIGTSIFLIALGLNCYRLGAPSLWFDEVYSVELVRNSFSHVWAIIFTWQPNMELYYLLLFSWLRLLAFLGVPATEFAVRFPSALCAALSAVVVFAIGRRFISTGAGVMGALLYLLNPHELIYAQQTRAYGMQLLFLCLGWYMLFAALTSERRWSRYWGGFTVAMVLAIYTHLISGIMLLTQVIAVIGALAFPHWRRSIWQRLSAFIVSLVAIGLALLPLVPVVRHGDATVNWLPVPRLHDMYWIFQVITGSNRWYLRLAAGSVLLGLIVVVFSMLCRTLHNRERIVLMAQRSTVLRDLLSHEYSALVLWSLFCWLFVPVILSYVISQTPTHIFSERYLVVIVPAFGLLVGLGVAVLRSRSVAVRAVQIFLVLCLLGETANLARMYYPNAQVEDWRSGAQWVMDRYQQHDGLVCYDNNQGCQLAMEYYFRTYPQSGAHFDLDTPGATRFWTPAYFANAGEAVNPDVLAAYASKYHRLFYITGRASEDPVRKAWQWLDQHYRLVGFMPTRTGITVRLYEIRP